MANVRMGKIDLSQRPSYIQGVDEEVVNKWLLVRGDVVVTLTGTRNKRDYGYIAMIQSEDNVLLNQRIARIRAHYGLMPLYLQLALQQEQFRDRFFSYETGNVGQGNVGMRAVTLEAIPLPPLAEQERIILEVERCLSVVDNLEQVVNANLKRAERLRQAILKDAFAGRLVPQDPNDEPASVLLERIQAEREAARASGVAARGRKGKADGGIGREGSAGAAVSSGNARRKRGASAKAQVQPELFSANGY